MSDKVQAIGNEKVKKNRFKEIQDFYAQNLANFSVPNKINSIFTENAPLENRVTGSDG